MQVGVVASGSDQTGLTQSWQWVAQLRKPSAQATAGCVAYSHVLNQFRRANRRGPGDSRISCLDRQNTAERTQIPGTNGGRPQKVLVDGSELRPAPKVSSHVIHDYRRADRVEARSWKGTAGGHRHRFGSNGFRDLSAFGEDV